MRGDLRKILREETLRVARAVSPSRPHEEQVRVKVRGQFAVETRPGFIYHGHPGDVCDLPLSVAERLSDDRIERVDADVPLYRVPVMVGPR